jgi:hypothetical protein
MEAAVRGGNSTGEVRVFVERSGGTDTIELWTLSETSSLAYEFSGIAIEDLQRLDSNSVGLLHSIPGSTRNPLALRIVTDDDASGASSQTQTIVNASDMSDNLNPSARGAFAPAPGDSSRYPIRLVVSYREPMDGYIEKFGIYDGNSLTKFERLTLPNLGLSSNSVDIRRVLFDQGNTVAFTGYGFSGGGPRLYRFDDDVMGPINSHSYAPENAVVLDAIGRAAGVNVGIAVFPQNMGEPMSFYAGQVPYSEVGNLDLMDLPLAKEWTIIAEMPAGSGAYRWIDDIFAFVAATTASNTQLKFALFDELGNERGEGLLPFNAMLPSGVTREDIDEVSLAPMDRDIATNGGRIHVTWTERHRDGTNNYDVLLYDQLECTPQVP